MAKPFFHCTLSRHSAHFGKLLITTHSSHLDEQSYFTYAKRKGGSSPSRHIHSLQKPLTTFPLSPAPASTKQGTKQSSCNCKMSLLQFLHTTGNLLRIAGSSEPLQGCMVCSDHKHLPMLALKILCTFNDCQEFLLSFAIISL